MRLVYRGTHARLLGLLVKISDTGCSWHYELCRFRALVPAFIFSAPSRAFGDVDRDAYRIRGGEIGHAVEYLFVKVVEKIHAQPRYSLVNSCNCYVGRHAVKRLVATCYPNSPTQVSAHF